MSYNINDDIQEIINRLEKENISFKKKKILVTGSGGPAGVNFLKSLRTYKLTRLLWLHIVSRFKESQLNFPLRKIELRQVCVEEKDDSPNEELLKFNITKFQ